MMRDIAAPRPGWFKMRLVKGGPWLPARIDQDCYCTVGCEEAHQWTSACDRHPHLRAVLDGREVTLERVWTSGREISEGEHSYLVQALAYDRAHGERSARADQPIDLDTINPRRFRP
jgi:hypothetical protein